MSRSAHRRSVSEIVGPTPARLTRPNCGICGLPACGLGRPLWFGVVLKLLGKRQKAFQSVRNPSEGVRYFVFFVFWPVRICSRQSLGYRGGCESATKQVRGLDQ